MCKIRQEGSLRRPVKNAASSVEWIGDNRGIAAGAMFTRKHFPSGLTGSGPERAGDRAGTPIGRNRGS